MPLPHCAVTCREQPWPLLHCHEGWQLEACLAELGTAGPQWNLTKLYAVHVNVHTVCICILWFHWKKTGAFLNSALASEKKRVCVCMRAYVCVVYACLWCAHAFNFLLVPSPMPRFGGLTVLPGLVSVSTWAASVIASNNHWERHYEPYVTGKATGNEMSCLGSWADIWLTLPNSSVYISISKRGNDQAS